LDCQPSAISRRPCGGITIAALVLLRFSHTKLIPITAKVQPMEGVNKSEPEVPQHLIDDAKPQLLETARFLRGVQDHHPDEFKTVAKKLKIGLRKAYHLAQIDR